MPAPSPLTAGSDLVSFAVNIDGRPLDDRYQVAALRVVHAANKIPSARLTLAADPSPAEAFPIGSAVNVLAGYHGQNQSIFTGRVATIGVQGTATSPLALVVDCRGETSPTEVTPFERSRPPVLSLTYGVDLLALALDENKTASTAKPTPDRIRGTLRFQGSALVHPGDTISVAALGERFDGDAWIGGVTHEIADGQWTTEVSTGLNPSKLSPLVGGPAVSGVQLGVVKQIAHDPTGEFRVLVQVPAIDPAGGGIWARLAQPQATSGAGFFFFPEVGDEVVLAFLDADPSGPLILGGLYSSVRPPSFTPDEKNSSKAIVTRGQLKVDFDDDKKILTLVTPGGNRLVLSDDDRSIVIADQNSNSIRLAADGITIASASNLTLKAAQGITVQGATGPVTLKSSGDVCVSATNITLSADVALTAQGNATASLSASGQTTVKGGIVMIN